MVKVISFEFGATATELRVDCGTVGDFLNEFSGTFNIPSDGLTIRVNGSTASRSTVLNSGDKLSLSKATGTKG